MNATSEELEREYDPLEDPIYVHGPIWFAIDMIVVDRLLAVINWSFESNPLVMQLGVGRWVALTAVMIIGMLYVWYAAEGVSNTLVRVLVWGIGVGHLSMVLLNLSVVFLS